MKTIHTTREEDVMIVREISDYISRQLGSKLEEEDDRVSSEIEVELHDGVIASFSFTATVAYNKYERGYWDTPSYGETGVDVEIDSVDACDEDDEVVMVEYDKDYIEDRYTF